MPASDFLEDALLRHVFESAAYTQPTIWVGLSTASPEDDESGLAEPVGGSYARVRPADATGRWTIAAAAGVTTAENKGAVEFPEASGDWGNITHVVLFDAETVGTGNVLAYGTLTNPRNVLTGDAATFAPGELEIQLD